MVYKEQVTAARRCWWWRLLSESSLAPGRRKGSRISISETDNAQYYPQGKGQTEGLFQKGSCLFEVAEGAAFWQDCCHQEPRQWCLGEASLVQFFPCLRRSLFVIPLTSRPVLLRCLLLLFEISKDLCNFKLNSCSNSSCTGPRESWKFLSSLKMSLFCFVFPLRTQNRNVYHHHKRQNISASRGHLGSLSSLWLPWIRIHNNLIGQLLVKSAKTNITITTIWWFPEVPSRQLCYCSKLQVFCGETVL